jgi:anti-sigma B factor antagonist
MPFIETAVGGAVLLKADGRIDMSNSDAFKDGLMAAVSAAERAVVIDLAGLDYISSAGLRSLMIALREAKGQSKAFGVAALGPLVMEIFTISRFNLVFSLYPTVRDAFAALEPASLDAFDAA